MMRVWDASNAIYDGLRELAWARYLRAMWIICGELQALYEDRLSGPERVLIEGTLGLVRQVAIMGEVTPEREQQAEGLHARWEALMSQREGGVKAGHWNTWVVFGELCGEIAGAYDQYTS